METREIQKSTILVVDDNPVNLKVMADCLTNYGFTVLLKKDGEKALELIQRRKPDIILLDILMPVMDGFETCRRIKSQEETKNIPVIFMTALTDPSDKLKGFEAGAVDYITKPFNREEVIARIKAHLTIQHLRNDLEIKNQKLQESLEREKKIKEELRLNLSISLPHELRTPLNALIGFSNLMIRTEQPILYEKIKEYGKYIYDNALRLHRLVENFLLYANLKLLKYTSSDQESWQKETIRKTGNFIASVAREIAAEAQRTDDLKLNLANATIRISNRNFEKILSELLDNAFKFSNPGQPVEINSTINGSLYLLSISDQGCGMTDEQIAHIGAYMQFDRRTHEQQGTGLGLVIAFLLLHLEGGMISVSSRPGQGTTISIMIHCESLPDENENQKFNWFSVDDLTGTDVVSGYRLTSKKAEEAVPRILIISDNAQNYQFVQNLFSHTGIGIFSAANRIDGWNLAVEHRPDMILIDMDIVEDDNFEILMRISGEDRLALTKVIVVTSEAISPEKKRRIAFVYSDMLRTPISVQNLLSCLEFYLELEWIYSERENELVAAAMPPEDELKALYEYACRGQIQNILDMLDRIEQRDSQYSPFVSQLRQYTESFQMNLIRNFVGKAVGEEKL